MKGEVMMGYIVLRKVELLRFNSAVIVDLLALEDDVLFALIERGIEYSRSLKTDLVGCMLPEGHPYTGILRRAGFLLSPRHFLFMVYPCKGEESLLRSRDWYVNWGDTDVI